MPPLEPNAVPLIAASQAGDATGKQLLNTTIQRSNVLQILPFVEPNKGYDFEWYESDETSGGNIQFRGINGKYTPSFSQKGKKSASCVPMGSSVAIDKMTESLIPGTLEDQIALRLERLGEAFNYYFIQGNASTDFNQFNGLKRLAELGDIQVLDPGAPLPVSGTKANTSKFLELLKTAMTLINGTPVIWLNDTIYNAIDAGFRDNYGAMNLGTTVDFTGQTIMTFKGAPMMRLGNFEGNDTLPMNEAGGTCSAYLTVLGNRAVAGVSKGGIKASLDDTGSTQHVATIDFLAGLKVPSRTALRIPNLQA